MKNPGLYPFYEKLYFHEIEAREQMTTRLQIPLALLISIVGALGFMVQNLERGQTGAWAHVFFGLFLASTAFLTASGYHCIRSAWGHDYSMLPVASDWDDYHEQCVGTYAVYPNSRQLVWTAIQTGIHAKYVECASVNARINELRSYHYHMTIKYLIVAVVLGFFAFVSFYFGNLDKSSHNKATEVRLVAPIELKGAENGKSAPTTTTATTTADSPR